MRGWLGLRVSGFPGSSSNLYLLRLQCVLRTGSCRRRAPAAMPPTRVVMEGLLSEYFPILVFLAIAGAIAVAMVGASFILARQQPNSEKLSPYECGFEPFEDARMRFDVRYYLVAILFIIVDLGAAFLFPWPASLPHLRVPRFRHIIALRGLLPLGRRNGSM